MQISVLWGELGEMAHFLLVGIYEPVSFCCFNVPEFQLKRCLGSVAFSLSQLGAG